VLAKYLFNQKTNQLNEGNLTNKNDNAFDALIFIRQGIN